MYSTWFFIEILTILTMLECRYGILCSVTLYESFFSDLDKIFLMQANTCQTIIVNGSFLFHGFNEKNTPRSCG